VQELPSSLTLFDLDFELTSNLGFKFVLSCENIGVAYSPLIGNYHMRYFFFLESAGELRIILIREEKGPKWTKVQSPKQAHSKQKNTHTTP
jgi:hypothetical protein